MKTSINYWIIAALVVACSIGFIGGKASSSSKQNGLTAKGHNRLDRDQPSLGARNHQRSKNIKRSHQDKKETLSNVLERMNKIPPGCLDFESIFQIWQITGDYTELQLKDAIENLESITNEELKIPIYMMLMQHWTEINGRASIDYLSKNLSDQNTRYVAETALRLWMHKDPDAALTWHEQSKAKNEDDAIKGFEHLFYSSLAQHDLSKSFDEVNSIPSKHKRLTALNSIVSGLASDPALFDSALKKIETNYDKNTLTSVIQSSIQDLSYRNPNQALEYIELYVEKEHQASLKNSLLSGWNFSDPKAAMTWAISQTDNEIEQLDIISSSLSNWVRDDSNSASKWYDQLPNKLITTEITHSAANTLLRNHDHKQALRWAAKSNDVDETRKLKSKIYQAWLEDSPTEASAWIAKEGVDIMKNVDISIRE